MVIKKKKLNLSLTAKDMTSLPTVKNHSTDYISLAITQSFPSERTKVHQ